MSSQPASPSPAPAPTLKQYGVTPPISTLPPTEEDIKLTAELESFLKESNFYESEKEGELRELVLGRLNALICRFVQNLAERKMLPNPSRYSGKIFTFGSYRLGVHSKGADIDTLCVVPQHVAISDCFDEFFAMLQRVTDITELTAVADAYVPVIKMNFSSISIDLVFARLPLPTIPADLDLLDSKILKNMDEKSMLSLNGSRTTDEMLRLVPCIETFHLSLRSVKLWAKRRGCYSNVMGYFAGVALALLTARICQLYPAASPSTILQKFFMIYQSWPWPQPILLKTIEEIPALGMRVWNPRINMTDRYHKMPIITPAFPSMCSTHNVTSSTLRLMTTEFQRANEVCERISKGGGTSAGWQELFFPTDFFRRHRNFFQILAISESKEEHLAWSGFIGSKVRHLTPKLELIPMIDSAPPFNEGFEKEVEVAAEEAAEASDFAANLTKIKEAHYFNGDGGDGGDGGVANRNNKNYNNITTEKNEKTKKTYYTIAYYVALVIKTPQAQAQSEQPEAMQHTQPQQAQPKQQLCLDEPVNDFKTFATNWEKITPGMNLVIRDIKRDALPSYVFEDCGDNILGGGRPLPFKNKKKKKVVVASSTSTTKQKKTFAILPNESPKRSKTS